MEKKGTFYEAELPGQPAAGKLIYRIHGTTPTSGTIFLLVVVRLDEVPAWLLILACLMFAGLLLAFRTGLEALRRNGRWQKLVPWTLAVVFAARSDPRSTGAEIRLRRLLDRVSLGETT